MMAAGLALFPQAAGTAAGAAPSPPQSTCVAPVYLVIEGRTLDRERMMAYGQAIAQSDLYQTLGGYYVTIPRPLDVFEGEVPPDYVNLTVRFPCIENARAFWNSRTYREQILPIRQDPSAGDYTVRIYAEAPVRQDMVGRVGDNRYIADFADPDIPQVDEPAVGPQTKGDKP